MKNENELEILNFISSPGNSRVTTKGVEIIKKAGEGKSYIRASYETRPTPAIISALAEVVQHLKGRKAYLTHDRRTHLPLLVVMADDVMS